MTTTKSIQAKAADAGETTAGQRNPKLIVAIGRQRVGKTTLLKILVELARKQGGDPEIWNTDTLNKSHAITSLGGNILSPPEGASAQVQTEWLDSRIGGMLEDDRDVIVDIGGGWTAMHELIHGAPLLNALDEMGVDFITLFVVGAERADLDYLQDMADKGVDLPNAIIVLNEGLLPLGASVDKASAEIIAHPAVQAVFENLGKFAVFPAMNNISRVTDRNQSFIDYAAGLPTAGHPPMSILDKLRVDDWVRRKVPAFLGTIGEAFLPHMPKGLPPVEAARKAASRKVA